MNIGVFMEISQMNVNMLRNFLRIDEFFNDFRKR